MRLTSDEVSVRTLAMSDGRMVCAGTLPEVSFYSKFAKQRPEEAQNSKMKRCMKKNTRGVDRSSLSFSFANEPIMN